MNLLTAKDYISLLDFPYLKEYLINNRRKERELKLKEKKRQRQPPKKFREEHPCPSCKSTNWYWYPSIQKYPTKAHCHKCWLVFEANG